MNYFGTSYKKDRGCPDDKGCMILYDAFYEPKEAQKIEYGDYPWYANKSLGQPHQKFPNGLHLIAKKSLIDFDIGSDYGFFHIVSDEFLATMQLLSAEFEDSAPIEVTDSSGKSNSSKKYHVIIFKKFPIESVLDLSKSEFFPRREGLSLHGKIKRYSFLSNFESHVFQIAGMDPGHNTVYCSEAFKNLAEQKSFKGVEFLSVEGRASGAFRQI
jgi:hypothetical protein